MNEATRQMPIIGDGDHGYGNALNVKRTVRGYAAAGFAGILIEDQVGCLPSQLLETCTPSCLVPALSHCHMPALSGAVCLRR